MSAPASTAPRSREEQIASLRRQIEIQQSVVDEAEAVVARREEFHAEQQTRASREGLTEARRDLNFYRKHLRAMQGELAGLESAA